MNKLIEFKLKALREFQSEYTNSHVGGSIGLMLRGIDLQRDITSSDLDITTDIAPKGNGIFALHEHSESNASDFDFALRKQRDNLYVKIDVRIDPKAEYDKIEYKGNVYNVSKYNDIIDWKQKYADKGVIKHKHDLIAIETGVRPKDNTSPIFDSPF